MSDNLKKYLVFTPIYDRVNHAIYAVEITDDLLSVLLDNTEYLANALLPDDLDSATLFVELPIEKLWKFNDVDYEENGFLPGVMVLEPWRLFPADEGIEMDDMRLEYFCDGSGFRLDFTGNTLWACHINDVSELDAITYNYLVFRSEDPEHPTPLAIHLDEQIALSIVPVVARAQEGWSETLPLSHGGRQWYYLDEFEIPRFDQVIASCELPDEWGGGYVRNLVFTCTNGAVTAFFVDAENGVRYECALKDWLIDLRCAL